MSVAQYQLPGSDSHDETADEGQYLDSGEGFIDMSADASSSASGQIVVVFVCT
jgi:hypothetical protein